MVRYCFHRCLSVHTLGVPWPGPARGVPQPGDTRLGTQDRGGYPARGCTHPGYPPPAVQQMEYLICRGRYASCVHAWGLSCLKVELHEWVENYEKTGLFQGTPSPCKEETLPDTSSSTNMADFTWIWTLPAQFPWRPSFLRWIPHMCTPWREMPHLPLSWIPQ